jgi:uncharacterized protein
VTAPAGQPIRANSILPARRTPLTLTTADGLSLVGELALPADREPVATLICLHPLPTHGGMMDSHVLRKAAWRLPALAGLAVLRFNTRGTSSERGTSEGSFDGGIGERYDVAAAIEYAEFADACGGEPTGQGADARGGEPTGQGADARGGEPTGQDTGLPAIWLLGWSFGSDLVLRYGCDPIVVGAILLSPPLRSTTVDDLKVWAASGKPVVALVPEFDDYLRPAEAEERFAVIPRAEVVGVPGAKHLWVGDAEQALDEVVKRVVPAAHPLPRRWDGPITTGRVDG